MNRITSNKYDIVLFDFLQTNYRTGKANVISIDIPWKIICSLQSDIMAGLIIPDSLIKKFGGNLYNGNEIFHLPYSIKIEAVKIESVENTSKKRKHAEE